MHVIENYFDACGFDHRLVQGGTSIYLWNMSRSFAARGHRVSVVTPAHGQLDHIRQSHEVQTLPYQDEYELAIPLDPRTWPDFPSHVTWKMRTTAHLVSLDGVDIYLLSNEVLDQLPDTFYPPYDAKGSDPVFFKPLVFQVDSIRFIRERFAGDRAIVHAHEPYYHYLVPAAFKDDPDKLVVSTVQSNMPITKMVYRKEVEELLAFLGVQTQLAAAQAAPTDPLSTTMSQYQQLTHLHYEYPSDYVDIFGLVADHAELVDFLSSGQADFYSTFADTPFEQLFARLPVSSTVLRNAHKYFVGGCALTDRWITSNPSTIDRHAVLPELGLDPGLPTFFHNARYALHHKGQMELMRAADLVLNEGLGANFIIRCLSGSHIDNDYFHDVARRHAGRLYLESHRVPEERVFAYAASADFCVFPSKFELDTFLIAQGEAMACGAVPIATAQQGMAHYRHVADPLEGPDRDTATGFAVNRSFAEDDRLLVNALAEGFRRAVRLLIEQPEEYRRLSANAAATARRFTWSRCTEQHLAAFQGLHDGQPAVLSDDDALRRGWFHLLSATAWQERATAIADRALALADLDAQLRLGSPSQETLCRLFGAAYARADFATCERVASLAPAHTPFPGLIEVRDRCQVTVSCTDPASWQVRYRLLPAERVQLVRPAPVGPGRKMPSVIELDRDGACFTGAFPGRPPETPLHFLITLTSGRTTWDSVKQEL
jgi:glycosyltransferase involved in cell wall biosynthesis